MEKDFTSFRVELARNNRKKQEGRGVYSFEDALNLVRNTLPSKLNELMEFDTLSNNVVKKDKSYLRSRKKLYTTMITDIVMSKNLFVRGYENDKIDNFISDVVEECVGYSILHNAFDDPSVSDIFAVKWNCIFVKRNGTLFPYNKSFRNEEHYKDFIERIIREAGKEINIGENKIVDFEIYGDRGCATSPAVSSKGYSVSIRKHPEKNITLEDIISKEIMDEKISDFILTMILGETNMIYGGITGCGKTTSLRALINKASSMIPKHIIVCEDTQELFLDNEDVLELVTVKNDNEKLCVTLQQLIYTALRLCPNHIVVGEVRGLEATSAVEGMETGQSTLFSMHGGTAWNILNRLVTKYFMGMPNLSIEVVERIVGSAVDYICIQDDIPGIGRKVTSISEVSYDFTKRTISIKDIVKYDFITSKFVWLGNISDEKAEKMMRRGIPYSKIKELKRLAS